MDTVDQLEQAAVVTVLEPLSDRSKALLRYLLFYKYFTMFVWYRNYILLKILPEA